MLQTNTPPQKVLAGSRVFSVQCVVLGTFVSVVIHGSCEPWPVSALQGIPGPWAPMAVDDAAVDRC